MGNSIKGFPDSMCCRDKEAFIYEPEPVALLDVGHPCGSAGQFLGERVYFIPSFNVVQEGVFYSPWSGYGRMRLRHFPVVEQRGIRLD